VLEIVAVVLLFLGTSSLPIIRYFDSKEKEDDDQKPLIK